MSSEQTTNSNARARAAIDLLSIRERLEATRAISQHDFWQYYDRPGEGHTVFANELIAFEAVMAMVRSGLLSRQTIFDTDSLGFMEYVKTIADTLETMLPKLGTGNVCDVADIQFLMAGRPDGDKDGGE